ncbi:MAG: restriction endonuclease [Chromatiales bacterium]|jgi:restriction system protein
MANRDGAIFEDLIVITARLPWWVGFVLAIVSYFSLHFVAGLQVERIDGIHHISDIAGKQMAVTFSRILQYVLPVVFILGSFLSIFQRYKKNRLYGHLKQNPDIQSLMELSWQEFELLVGKYFEEKGYAVRQSALPGPDGGYDLVAIKDGDKYLVQCKQWRSTSVGVKVVRELLGAIAASGAVGGFVVSSGRFTNPAKEFVQGRNISLIDGLDIVDSVSVEGVLKSQESFGDTLPRTREAEAVVPNCPKCGAAMVLRTARKGQNAGSQFWGCSSFPQCKGTRALET